MPRKLRFCLRKQSKNAATSTSVNWKSIEEVSACLGFSKVTDKKEFVKITGKYSRKVVMLLLNRPFSQERKLLLFLTSMSAHSY